MPKRTLTERYLDSLRRKPALPGKRYDVMDAVVPGFGVRVSDKRRLTFVLVGRFPGKPHPTRRAIGEFGKIGLKEARRKAHQWLKWIGEGVDPAREEKAAYQTNLAKYENTLAAVAEDYIRLELIGPDPRHPRQRKAREVERVIRTIFMPLWSGRPITEIGRRDILALVEAVRDHGTVAALIAQGVRANGGKENKRIRGAAPSQARNLLGHAKTLFSFAVERGTYGLDASPCDHLRTVRILGDKAARDRILSDAEVFAFWRAASWLSYPYGPLYRLLALTGLRLNEVADATWSEFDIENERWTIPAFRMKGKNTRARPHVVPLTADILALLASLPRFGQGNYLFSTTFGKTPVWVTNKVKRRLDGRMLRTLRALSRLRGGDAAAVKLEPWQNHDLRRTLRSGLSALRIHSDVAEALLAHAKPGIRGVYDRYDLYGEKKDALERWGAQIRILSAPPRFNVIPIRGVRA